MTCDGFLTRAAAYFAAHGITRIERVMTDNAWAYQHSIKAVCASWSPAGVHPTALPLVEHYNTPRRHSARRSPTGSAAWHQPDGQILLGHCRFGLTIVPWSAARETQVTASPTTQEVHR